MSQLGSSKISTFVRFFLYLYRIQLSGCMQVSMPTSMARQYICLASTLTPFPTHLRHRWTLRVSGRREFGSIRRPNHRLRSACGAVPDARLRERNDPDGSCSGKARRVLESSATASQVAPSRSVMRAVLLAQTSGAILWVRRPVAVVVGCRRRRADSTDAGSSLNRPGESGDSVW
jgi:hypothetical protein